MITAVTNALSTVIGWVGTVISAIVSGGENAGALNALLPLLAVSVAISALMLGIRIIRSVIWGA